MNKTLKILLWGSNLWYLGEGLLGPLVAIFAQNIGGSILDISWAWAVYLCCAGCMEMLVGKYSDAWLTKERWLVIGYVLNTFFTFCYAFVQTPGQLFVVEAGLGVAVALATPTWQALYAIHGTRKNAGQAWGLASGQARIMTGLATVMGGVIVQATSFRVLFMIMGSIQLIATLYQAQILKIKRRRV